MASRYVSAVRFGIEVRDANVCSYKEEAHRTHAAEALQ